MRDDSIRMLQIVGRSERDGLYYGVVRLTVASITTTLEFGVDRAGYQALTRILQFRPFPTGARHRYYFQGGSARPVVGGGLVPLRVRVESGKDARGFDFQGPTSLTANLLWFKRLQRQQTLEPAAALRRVSDEELDGM